MFMLAPQVGYPAQSRQVVLSPANREGCKVIWHLSPLARLIERDELLAAAAVPLRTTTG